MKIRPAKRLRGRVRVPGDKSVSHRAAMLGALAAAGGRTRVTNFSSSADCAATLACLSRLGVGVSREGATVEIEGAGLELPRAPAAPLDCGNSGTTLRLLAGLLAGQSFRAVLTGDESLRSRPMRRVIEPLELMGARLAADEGRAPVAVEGRRPLRAIRYELPVASAQVKSCVLLAGLNADGRTQVVETRGETRDHTERLLAWFGAGVETRAEAGAGGEAARVVSVEGGRAMRARDVSVPGDISSAAFLFAAAAMLPGSELTVEGVGLNPTRAGVLEVFSALGADVRAGGEREESNEPVGDIRARGRGGLAPARDGANRLGGARVGVLIDELPVLAVLGTRVEGGLEIRGAKELRVKESDRIRAVVDNLRAMGAEVEEYEDGLAVCGPARLRGARVRSHGDHRIAMAFAVAALAAEGDTEIEGAGCVSVSFPDFFPLLESLIER
ncbi:MAG: 3-phosphoshikimate 1-carboxyvinyltransferase [Acidobacteria bacterium]|nr:3-phosphoshikimate 1-carboxyvinyltransferase [Acidobacteriota bacterium]